MLTVDIKFYARPVTLSLAMSAIAELKQIYPGYYKFRVTREQLNALYEDQKNQSDYKIIGSC